ncbi:MAG: glucose dehydrogenase [Gammaproteobacteria bacterium RIFCSPHIGHO2_12_FULL_63_22]|nr:MAG: glucose dehydrogenase [Gammaproteobacteria bacterium RIFCSPHIGHO2_12_FULL_63_22]
MMHPLLLSSLSTLVLVLGACSAQDGAAAAGKAEAPKAVAAPFAITEVATFNEPWAMSFLPDGHLLVTEKSGQLKLVATDGRVGKVSGVPAVAYAGQGGLGDVVAHPGFAENGWVYLSYAEADDSNNRGAVVARAKLAIAGNGDGSLSELSVIWRQEPKMSGGGHYGHRIAFGQDGKLWISSGDRQHFDPAQDMSGNLGKILRLNDDGSLPDDNPFASEGGVAAQVWSLGHRNPLGLAFDGGGRPWVAEMGPRGGDELNLIVRGRNYGWPVVSNGDHYDGRDIPDHSTNPKYEAPKISWTPVIAPGDLIIYTGSEFPAWDGNGFAAGLASEALVRIEFDGDNAREAARYDMGKRIRAVEQGPKGELWLLEDGAGGRLLKLSDPSSREAAAEAAKAAEAK